MGEGGEREGDGKTVRVGERVNEMRKGLGWGGAEMEKEDGVSYIS